MFFTLLVRLISILPNNLKTLLKTQLLNQMTIYEYHTDMKYSMY